jgi:hypothetical protein
VDDTNRGKESLNVRKSTSESYVKPIS